MLDPTWEVREGNCLDVLPTLDADSVDAIVTDPPAGIGFMGKEWDNFGSQSRSRNSDRTGGKPWSLRTSYHGEGIGRDVRQRDSFVAFLTTVMSECYRVLKPGGHALVWAIPRTAHWTTWAIEDAGFEIRDVVLHLFGSGFPKSRNVGNGWGTALKPASEHWVLARKPLSESNVASNVLRWGTGAINVDGCRIDGAPPSVPQPAFGSPTGQIYGFQAGEGRNGEMSSATGRWPANVTLDEDAARLLDEASGERPASGLYSRADGTTEGRGAANFHPTKYAGSAMYEDRGGASRFFYTAKAGRAERNVGLYGLPRGHPVGGADKWTEQDRRRGDGVTRQPSANVHPTVKPVALMQWLCRLITPPGGLVLDPFAGSGSTGIAALREGFGFLGIERELEYVTIARARIEGDAPLFNTQEVSGA